MKCGHVHVTPIDGAQWPSDVNPCWIYECHVSLTRIASRRVSEDAARFDCRRSDIPCGPDLPFLLWQQKEKIK